MSKYEIFVCPKCHGKKQLEDEEEVFPSPGADGPYYPPCYLCDRWGFIVLDMED